jgi:NitT/TauT family transport system ATP-binding protein
MMTALRDTNVIEFEDVVIRFNDHLAVDRLSFSVRRGEILALLGRTGAGKSTVMNLLMGAIAPDQGRIRVNGVDPYAEFKRLRGKIAVAFQTDRLLPWRTAEENVALGLIILGRPKAEAHEAARRWLARVKLGDAGGKYVHELSGGMRQRASLARALAVDPDLVLLDESFSQLDPVTSKELRADFSAVVRQFEKTCVFVTHRIEDALEMADRVLILAAPARVCLEARIGDAQRADAARMAELHHEIEQAIGADPLGGRSGAASPEVS